MLSGAQKLEDRLKNFRETNGTQLSSAQKKAEHDREVILNEIKHSQAKK